MPRKGDRGHPNPAHLPFSHLVSENKDSARLGCWLPVQEFLNVCADLEAQVCWSFGIQVQEMLCNFPGGGTDLGVFMAFTFLVTLCGP